MIRYLDILYLKNIIGTTVLMTTIQWQDTEVQDVTNVEVNCSLAHNVLQIGEESGNKFRIIFFFRTFSLL